MLNDVVKSGTRFFHPATCPAPYGWARISGERVELPYHRGLWCEIEKNQPVFQFELSRTGFMVTIAAGFRNPDLNGKALDVGILLEGNLDLLRTVMKSLGLPSCTRLNLWIDFVRWYHSTVVEV